MVVSAGAGRDVSFELALIDYFGCHVLLLDPSPTGIETMSLAKNQHPKLHFMKLALVGRDGLVSLHEPVNSLEGSFSSMVGKVKGPEVEGISLSTLLKNHGWTGIDLLKMDIEGGEYAVVDSILRDKIPLSQICVEYHNQILPGIKTSWTAGSLARLAWAGWRIVHKSGSNHTLLNETISG